MRRPPTVCSSPAPNLRSWYAGVCSSNGPRRVWRDGLEPGAQVDALRPPEPGRVPFRLDVRARRGCERQRLVRVFVCAPHGVHSGAYGEYRGGDDLRTRLRAHKHRPRLLVAIDREPGPRVRRAGRRDIEVATDLVAIRGEFASHTAALPPDA